MLILNLHRQRRHFYYLTGCNVPDCYYTYDLSSQASTLYIPPIDPSSVIWSGLPLSREEALKKFEVDHVKYSSEVNPSLAALPAGSKTAVWAINDQVSPHITFLEFDKKDFAAVKKAIEECRVVKDDYEIALTKRANEVSEIAHTAVLKAVKHAKNERELEGLFIEKCIANGCRDQAYHSIVASGINGATLHYQKNDEDMAGRLNMLLDAGGEYNCYASDITRTFPINGKWTKESLEIYNIVLQMQLECTEMLKEGILWDSVHEHAHKVAIKGLLKIGLLKGTAQEIFESRTSVAFFPHGLGHYLGMDTHDTGGNPNYDDKDTMFMYLRVRGTLPAGSIITVEPGVKSCLASASGSLLCADSQVTDLLLPIHHRAVSREFSACQVH
jgi:Xaa-Pro dipeptidase